MQAGPYNPLTTEQPGKPAHSGALGEGEVVDRYVVVGWLGEGGVASVFRVRHTTLNTAYALKVLKIPRPDLRERLLREGRLQAALQHPNIVRVHDVLTVHGSPALVLDLIEGPSLRQELERGPLATPALLGVARALAAALVHAHARGVVHRDLKPANILLTHLPGGPQPHITDFGIARLLEATPEAGATLTGGILGTMAYMAPEQLRCSRDVGCAADMFSLGVILYELACGQRPFAAVEGDPVAMAEAISAQRYAPLEARRADLHPTFYEAVAACLLDAASARPDAAAALALLTPPAPLIAAAPSPIARRVTPSFMGALALCVVLGGGAGALVPRHAPTPAPAQPTQTAPEDSAQRDALEAARLEASAWRVAGKDAGHALALLRAAAQLAPDQAGRLLDPLVLARLERAGADVRVLPQRAQVNDVAADPAGALLAVGTNSGAVELWDTRTGERRWVHQDPRGVEVGAVRFMPDGKHLLVTPYTNTRDYELPRPAALLDVGAGDVRHTFAHGEMTYQLISADDGRLGVTVGIDQRAQLWSLRTGAPERALPITASTFEYCGTFSKDSRWLAIGNSGKIALYDTNTWQLTRQMGASRRDIQCSLAFAPDARSLLLSGWSGLERWSVPDGKLLARAPHDAYQRFVVSPDARTLLEHDERGAALTDAATLKRINALRGHQGRVMDAAYSPDGQRLITASTDHTARVWSGSSGAPLLTLRGHTSWVFSADLIARDGALIAVTGARDATVRLWTMPHGQQTRLFPPDSVVSHLAMSKDWQQLIAVAAGRRVLMERDGEAMRTVSEQPVSPHARHAISEDGRWRVTVDGHTATIEARGEPPRVVKTPHDTHWFLRISNAGHVLLSHGLNINTLAPGASTWTAHTVERHANLANMTPDGALIVTVADAAIHVIRGGALRIAPREQHRVSGILFSPDQREVIVTDWEGYAERWDLDAMRLIERVKLHDDGVIRVVALPDQRGFVTASLDHSIRVWSWGPLKQQRVMRGHEADILALAASPDGRRLATGDKDGQIIVWDLDAARPTRALWAAVAVHALRFDGDALEGIDQDNQRWRWSLKDAPPLVTNYRVCRATGAVVPITPYPAPDTVWADESACP